MSRYVAYIFDMSWSKVDPCEIIECDTFRHLHECVMWSVDNFKGYAMVYRDEKLIYVYRHEQCRKLFLKLLSTPLKYRHINIMKSLREYSLWK